MTYEEALKSARITAEQHAWPWIEPVAVIKRRKYILFGPLFWHIKTNANSRGSNVVIEVDDMTGKVVVKKYWQR
jgi:hypothetical protein